MGVAWDTLLDGNVRTLIERDLLMPFLQRQRWFGGKARSVRSARFTDWGLLRRGPQPLFITIVEVDLRRRRAGQLLPAAGDLRDRRSARRRGAVTARGAGAGDRRAKGRALRRLARQRLRPRVDRDVRAAAGHPIAPRHAGAVQTSGVRTRSAASGPLDISAALRRAEQHVPRLRQSADPQAVQAPAAWHQPRLRDRPATDRAHRLSASAGRGRSHRISDDRGSSRRRSRCCSSSSRARRTAGGMRPTR